METNEITVDAIRDEDLREGQAVVRPRWELVRGYSQVSIGTDSVLNWASGLPPHIWTPASPETLIAEARRRNAAGAFTERIDELKNVQTDRKVFMDDLDRLFADIDELTRTP